MRAKSAGRWPLTLALLGALGGCGERGSSFGSGDGASSGHPQAVAWEAHRTLAARVGALDATPAGAMPETGSATYRGFAAVQYRPGVEEAVWREDALLGSLELRADFAAGLVDGTVDDWSAARGGPVAGRLDIGAAQIGGAALVGSAAGVLSNGGRAMALDLDLAGAFVGSRAGAVAGRMDGLVDFADGASGFAEGEFAAERRN
jgi:hypothetical protein